MMAHNYKDPMCAKVMAKPGVEPKSHSVRPRADTAIRGVNRWQDGVTNVTLTYLHAFFRLQKSTPKKLTGFGLPIRDLKNCIAKGHCKFGALLEGYWQLFCTGLGSRLHRLQYRLKIFDITPYLYHFSGQFVGFLPAFTSKVERIFPAVLVQR